MVTELHLHLDNHRGCIWTYQGTVNAIRTYGNCVHTTIPSFLSFEYAERLFVHFNGEIHEITLGECDGTKRTITKSHNILNLLMSGEFEWYR